MFKAFSRWYLKRHGWTLSNRLPEDLKKCVVVAAPHTSNQDFLFTRTAFFMLDAPVKFVIKKEAMFFPLSILLKALGAVPVNRKKKENFTEAMVRMFNESEVLHLIIAPEGTRKAVDRWKTGFYHIAVQAGVPIVLGFLDYKRKLAGFGPIIYPSGNMEEDFAIIRAFYETITPKFPEQYQVRLFAS